MGLGGSAHCIAGGRDWPSQSAAMLDLKLPAVCDVSVTNVCNAACDFCGFARDKTLAGAARYVDAGAFSQALPILHRRGIRYMTLQGGEPLVYPDIIRLVSETAAAGMSCAIITNGWFLPRYITRLAAAGLRQLIVSIDSAKLAEHERNRAKTTSRLPRRCWPIPTSALPKSRTVSAFLPRRSIGISPPREPQMHRTLENDA
jgi:MoaA/NifB/PqqE/SkfB family radical SAM enzyme